MQIHKMKDATDIAGGPGYADLPIRKVRVQHPTNEGQDFPAYECEFVFDLDDLAKVLSGGKIRICILGERIVPIMVTVTE